MLASSLTEGAPAQPDGYFAARRHRTRAAALAGQARLSRPGPSPRLAEARAGGQPGIGIAPRARGEPVLDRLAQRHRLGPAAEQEAAAGQVIARPAVDHPDRLVARLRSGGSVSAAGGSASAAGVGRVGSRRVGIGSRRVGIGRAGSVRWRHGRLGRGAAHPGRRSAGRGEAGATPAEAGGGTDAPPAARASAPARAGVASGRQAPSAPPLPAVARDRRGGQQAGRNRGHHQRRAAGDQPQHQQRQAGDEQQSTTTCTSRPPAPVAVRRAAEARHRADRVADRCAPGLSRTACPNRPAGPGSARVLVSRSRSCDSR